MAMTNELKMIEALENVAKSFNYNMIYFSADKHEGVTIHFEEPDYVELKADGKTVEKIVKEL
jgi:hypothetical protein